MQKVIIDVPNLSNPQNIVNESLASALIIKAYKNGIFIPKNATNGDVIKALFPNYRTDEMSHSVWVGYDNMSFKREWWNAPYKAGSEE